MGFSGTFLVPSRTRGPRNHARHQNLAGPPRPRGNRGLATFGSHKAATPAEAGAQLGIVALVGAAPRYLDLSNWTPAFAGVVTGGMAGARATKRHGREL